MPISPMVRPELVYRVQPVLIKPGVQGQRKGWKPWQFVAWYGLLLVMAGIAMGGDHQRMLWDAAHPAVANLDPQEIGGCNMFVVFMGGMCLLALLFVGLQIVYREHHKGSRRG